MMVMCPYCRYKFFSAPSWVERNSDRDDTCPNCKKSFRIFIRGDPSVPICEIGCGIGFVVRQLTLTN